MNGFNFQLAMNGFNWFSSLAVQMNGFIFQFQAVMADWVPPLGVGWYF